MMKQANSCEELEFDMRELIVVVLRKLWIVLLIGIIFAISLFLISQYVIEWKYESTTKIYVLSKEDNTSPITYADLETGSQLTHDYMTLITSTPVTKQVIEELELNMNQDELAKSITVENPTDTRILNITVEYKDPVIAKEIADAVRENSAVLINTVMDLEQVNMIEEGNIPKNPSAPNVKRNTVLGGALGIVISAFMIILVYILDDTIKTPEDIEKHLGISVLGSIPIQKRINKLKKRKRIRKESNKE